MADTLRVRVVRGFGTHKGAESPPRILTEADYPAAALHAWYQRGLVELLAGSFEPAPERKARP